MNVVGLLCISLLVQTRSSEASTDVSVSFMAVKYGSYWGLSNGICGILLSVYAVKGGTRRAG